MCDQGIWIEADSALYAHLDILGFDRSANLAEQDNASSIVTFQDQCFKDNIWLSPRELR